MFIVEKIGSLILITIENEISTSEINQIREKLVKLASISKDDVVVSIYCSDTDKKKVQKLSVEINELLKYCSGLGSRKFIMIIASLGILVGVTFSSGMMEVARKGIFHPGKFDITELMTIFLAVMLTDILLLDLFNTMGLPTSTTVSIVFELLGAAVTVSLLKLNILGNGFSNLSDYINTGKALAIISGILLSVIVAFIVGAILQFFTRLVFTFNVDKNLKKYGAIWGGIALSAISYFILIKGAKGASFIAKDTKLWIKSNAGLIVIIIFLVFWIFFQIFQMLFKFNILKIVVLVGTFALAMAFAANDLVNFIGVPLAGLKAFQADPHATGKLLTELEGKQPLPFETLLLIIAGLIMVITLWLSKKARTVSKTELGLGRQDEGIEKYDSTPLSRAIVRMGDSLGNIVNVILPKSWQKVIDKRIDYYSFEPEAKEEDQAFDLLRASVNLMAASMLISFATSLKLPLSTTYVTFMVSMGTSFADRAWGRDSAVYRITGVITVIGGWFMTAFIAFSLSSVFAVSIFYWKPSVLVILLFTIIILMKNRKTHKKNEDVDDSLNIFNLKKVKDIDYAIDTSFNHAGIFLEKVANSLDVGFSGLFKNNRLKLREVRKETKVIQQWANIIIANMFKFLRLFQATEYKKMQPFSKTIETLQEIVESNRDIIVRAYNHINNNHTGLLDIQIEELKQIKKLTLEVIILAAKKLKKEDDLDLVKIREYEKKLDNMVLAFNEKQVKRIQDNSSKTRLSILFYGLIWDTKKILTNTISLLSIFKETTERRK